MSFGKIVSAVVSTLLGRTQQKELTQTQMRLLQAIGIQEMNSLELAEAYDNMHHEEIEVERVQSDMEVLQEMEYVTRRESGEGFWAHTKCYKATSIGLQKKREFPQESHRVFFGGIKF